MFVVWIIGLLVSVFALFHSYVFYPMLLRFLSKGKSPNALRYTKDEQLPFIHIVMAAYNEELVLDQKLISVFRQDYPANRWKLYVGSDASTDRTNEILSKYAQVRENFEFHVFQTRNGKASILNYFVDRIQAEDPDGSSVLILTDANVMFHPDLLYQLASHFKNPEVGQVSAQIVNPSQTEEGISEQEAFYIQRENRIKYYEGLVWGCVQGAFGACYAMRTSLFTHIPSNFLMEDFYLSMHILRNRYKAIVEPAALAYEDVSTDLTQEFRRKRRISAGNYQNLFVFGAMLFRFNSVAFSFFSHKLLRWCGPFFLLLALFSNLALCFWNEWFYYLFCLQLALMLSPVLYVFLKTLEFDWKPLKWLSYFYAMNLALLLGLLQFLAGVQSGFWEPTKRSINS